jgi:hypothetical protein
MIGTEELKRRCGLSDTALHRLRRRGVIRAVWDGKPGSGGRLQYDDVEVTVALVYWTLAGMAWGTGQSRRSTELAERLAFAARAGQRYVMGTPEFSLACDTPETVVQLLKTEFPKGCTVVDVAKLQPPFEAWQDQIRRAGQRVDELRAQQTERQSSPREG